MRLLRPLFLSTLALLVLTLGAAPPQAQEQARYEVIDLGTLGGEQSGANALNDRGQVVGWAETGAENEGEEPIYHAFIWDRERGMRDLGTLGGAHSGANDINTRGNVVGWAELRAPRRDGDDEQAKARPASQIAARLKLLLTFMLTLGLWISASDSAIATRSVGVEVYQNGRLVLVGTGHDTGRALPVSESLGGLFQEWGGYRVKPHAADPLRASLTGDIRILVHATLTRKAKGCNSGVAQEPVWDCHGVRLFTYENGNSRQEWGSTPAKRVLGRSEAGAAAAPSFISPGTVRQ